jgi:chromosome segregation ATPase
LDAAKSLEDDIKEQVLSLKEELKTFVNALDIAKQDVQEKEELLNQAFDNESDAQTILNQTREELSKQEDLLSQTEEILLIAQN